VRALKRKGEARWEARICYGDKTHYLGLYDTKQEAALAYDRKARRCGEKRALNFDSMEEAKEAAARARATHTAKHGPERQVLFKNIRNPIGVHTITETRIEEGWRIVQYKCKKRIVHCPCGKKATMCHEHGGQYLCAHRRNKYRCTHCKREGAEKATYGII
jgi:hypothetical protein